MKYTKRTKQNKHDRKETTWQKFKQQQNKLSADRRGLRTVHKRHW
ncbi:hypothetical protein [Fructilactobacillus hinvesii]|nr:hypothetical protein [Fructilactobacillus hinvesii]